MDIYDNHIGQLLSYNMDYEWRKEQFVDDEWGEFKPLFLSTDFDNRKSIYPYGCLTQVKSGALAPTKELTLAIQLSDIHTSPEDLFDDLYKVKTYAEMVEILWPYAEFQRRIDAESRMVENY